MSSRIAPRSFIDEVQRIDPSLDIEWSDKHARWFITQKSYSDGSIKYILVVQSDEGKYRDLDKRFLPELNRMFFKDPDVQDIGEHIKKQRAKREEDFDKEVADRSDDQTDYLWNAIAGNKVIGMGETLKKEETVQ